MKRSILLSLFLLISAVAIAQTRLQGENAKAIHPQAREVYFKADRLHPSFVAFRPGTIVSNANTSGLLNAINQAGTDYYWQLSRTDFDEIGYSHERYQLFYKGVPVIGSEAILHIRNGNLISLNSTFTEINGNQNATIEENRAFMIARDGSGANRFIWEMPETEQDILLGHSHNHSRPAGKLVFLPPNGYVKARAAELCWEYEIYTYEPHGRWRIFVDAETGEILHRENKICGFVATGTGNSKYSGTISFKTDSLAANSFRLRDFSRSGGIETWDMNKSTSYSLAVDFTDSNNIWTDTSNQDNAALDAHWGTQQTYDYYLSVHNRNSIDNAGLLLKSYVHYGSNYNNAFWNGSVMTYGDGNGSTFSPLTELDIVAHELTHGVTEYTSNLVYSYESGALNESFSDIFGVSVDFFARPAQANWIIADQSYTPATPGDGIRYMNNPNAANDPDTYQGNFWYTGSGDNGGVHTNSGVQNFWYYLLCTGGSGTNDHGNPYSVTGIGISNARQIAYRTNSFYLTSASDYQDAAYYSIVSANDLFGNCSFEAQQTKNAWDAVGIYGLSLNTLASASLVSTACSGADLLLQASGGQTFAWTGPAGFSSSLQNPVIPAVSSANNGTYTCVITDGLGCSGTALVPVTVNPSPLVTASGGSICSGSSLQLSSSSSIIGAGGNSSFNNTPLAIPDNNVNGASSSISITGSTSASSILSVTIDSLTHTWDADLRIELVAPNGSSIVLANGVGGSGDNFINTTFSMTAPFSIANGSAPFNGSYQPQNSFALLTGSANGIWQLRIKDLFGSDVGTLYKWSINCAPNSISVLSWSPALSLSNPSIASPLASPPTSTIYTLLVKDLIGCSSIDTALVLVQKVNIDFTATNPGCDGASNGAIDLTVSGGTAPYNYAWSQGAQTEDLNNLPAGIYIVTVTDTYGCTASDTIQLNPGSSVLLSLTPSPGNCSINNGSITATASGGTAPYAYTWNNGATTATLSGLASGVYTCIVSDINGCSASASVSLTNTGTAPATPSSIIGTRSGICTGTTATYSVASQPNTNYFWSVNSGAVILSGQGTPVVTVSFPVSYTSAVLSVYAQNSCGQSPLRTATVRSVPARPGSIVGPSKNLCGQTGVIYSVPAVSGAASYTWTVPAFASIVSGQGTNSIVVNYSQINATGGSICVSASNACGSSLSRCMTGVNTTPAKPAAISGPATVCAGQSNVAYSVAPQSGVTFNWVVPAGAIISSGQGTASVTVNFGASAGIVKVSPTNACGSNAATSLNVSFTCREESGLLSDHSSIRLAPNPTAGQTQLIFENEPGLYSLEIMNAHGKVVLSSQAGISPFTLQTESLSPGVYLVRVRPEGKAETVLRLVITR